MGQRYDKQKIYVDIIAEADHAVKNMDASEMEALETEKNTLSEEISAMNGQMTEVQEEIASLEQNIAQLQQEYDQLAQEEDSVYYLKIFQSLTEGMSMVESYINGNE